MNTMLPSQWTVAVCKMVLKAEIGNDVLRNQLASKDPTTIIGGQGMLFGFSLSVCISPTSDMWRGWASAIAISAFGTC